MTLIRRIAHHDAVLRTDGNSALGGMHGLEDGDPVELELG